MSADPDARFEYLASSIAFARVSLEESCARVAALGLRSIDLWFVKGMCEHLPPEQAALDLPRIRRALQAHGLRLHALSVYGASTEVTFARLEQLAELGGSILVRDAMSGGQSDPRIVVEKARPFVERAEKLGVLFAPENHGATAFDSIAQLQHVTAALPSPHFGVAYAPIHTHRLKEDPAAAVRALGARIALCYAWDWGASADAHWKDPREQLPGTGGLDFPALFSALREAGQARALCLFAHGIEEWPAAQAEEGLRQALAFCREVESSVAVEAQAGS